MATVAPVIPPSVSPLPTPPSTTDPQNFDVRADAFLGSLPTNQSEMNALGSNVYNNALKTYNSATDANAAASVAVPAADSANNSAVAAANAYTNMQKLYLGAKSTPPAQDNQGNTLSLGAWYTNTTSGYWYWWDGSTWKLGMSDLSSVDWATQVTGKPTTLVGYGITDQVQARTDLGLKSAAVADIVGTVSQTGGVPTGALMQYGTNANGEFWRFASGLQICTRLMPQAERTYATGDLVGVAGWTFPASFSAKPFVNSTLEGLSSYLFRYGHEIVNNSQVTNFFFRYDGTVALSARVMVVNWLAIGRWF